jgi:hypothetical protein
MPDLMTEKAVSMERHHAHSIRSPLIGAFCGALLGGLWMWFSSRYDPASYTFVRLDALAALLGLGAGAVVGAAIGVKTAVAPADMGRGAAVGAIAGFALFVLVSLLAQSAFWTASGLLLILIGALIGVVTTAAVRGRS